MKSYVKKTHGCLICMIVAWVMLGGSVVNAGNMGEAGGDLQAGTEISYLNYEEPDFVEEEGVLFGVFGQYTYRWQENERLEHFKDLFSRKSLPNVLSADIRAMFGTVDYDSIGTGSINNINNYIIETRGLLGQDFPILEESLLTPYVGIGFRYRNDDLSGKVSTTGHLGYERESYYVYIPIGVSTLTPLANNWSLGFNVEFDIFIDGQQDSHLEDVNSALSTLKNDQNEGYGVRGSMTVAKKMDNLDIFVQPFVRYWDIKDSAIGVVTCGGTPCALGYEPENNTLEAGARVGIMY